MKAKYTFILFISFLLFASAKAQQFNTDNYLAMPHGTSTFVLTAGERNAGVVNSFALLPHWEFFAQATLFWSKESQQIPQHFTTNIYFKYMFYENTSKTGGGAIFFGIGKSPGYFEQTQFTNSHKNFWTAVPITFPFFDNMLSWDIMPGAILDIEYGEEKKTAWGFTYSSRLAVYHIIPQSAIVGEIYGTSGEVYSKPEYKIGIRWEPNNTVIPAITYGSSLHGSGGAGVEIGVMIFTPQFLKIGK